LEVEYSIKLLNSSIITRKLRMWTCARNHSINGDRQVAPAGAILAESADFIRQITPATEKAMDKANRMFADRITDVPRSFIREM
jgi:hypothetical protein